MPRVDGNDYYYHAQISVMVSYRGLLVSSGGTVTVSIIIIFFFLRSLKSEILTNVPRVLFACFVLV